MVTTPINPFMGENFANGSETPEYSLTYKGIFNELLNKSIDIFEFKGLPETVNERFFKTALILTGNCALLKVNGNWYAVKGRKGAEPDEYYIPREYITANPVLGSANTPVQSNEVQVFNWTTTDELCQIISSGMKPLLDRTARTLADIYISIIVALKNSRLVNIFSAATDVEKQSLNRLIRDMRNGKDTFTALQDLKSKMTVNPVVDNSEVYRILQELVELYQFTLANFYHSIGINSNYNLKRAQVNNEEIMTNSYILIVSLYDTELQLKKAVEEFNTKSGLNVSVDYSEAWLKLRESQETPVGEKKKEDTQVQSTEEKPEETEEVESNEER